MSIQNQTSTTIKCSAGKGELPKDECLACALAGSNTCGYDYALIAAMFSDKVRTGIHVTDLTGCLRNAYYVKTVPVAEYVHDMLNRFLGTGVHKYIESFPSDEYRNEVALKGLGLEGTADIIYKNGRLTDFKTTRWMKPGNLPYVSHVQQLNIYAAMLRENGVDVKSAAIQYIDLSGPPKCKVCKGQLSREHDGVPVCTRCERLAPEAHNGALVVEIPLDDHQDIAQWIETRRSILEMSIETGSVPDMEESYLCGYCPFYDICDKVEEARNNA
jgi:CRISPR/Cas system-associated exonuclease Cas4 (RecB family)